MEKHSKDPELTRGQDFTLGMVGGTLAALSNLPFDTFTTAIKSKSKAQVLKDYKLNSKGPFWRQYIPARLKELQNTPGEAKTLLSTVGADIVRKALGWGLATYAIGGLGKHLKEQNKKKQSDFITAKSYGTLRNY